MVIYLKHPKHGNKVACSEGEALADEKNGWERYKLGALLTPEKPAETVNALVTEIPDIREAYHAKFGKYPHHRMKEEGIRRALA